MKRMVFFRSGILAVLILLVAGSVPGQQASKPVESNASKLIYADFQDLQAGRPVSKKGGMIRLNRYSQNSANPPQYRGLENADPPAPAFARVTAEDAAAAFDYEMRLPNEWEGVNMEVFGHPEKDGKLVPDDVSGFKFISLRAFAKGAQYLRVELITRGQGTNLESGYPTATFRLSPGFNTYRLKLDSFNQPDWAVQLDLKRDVLKKLTSLTVGVHCDKMHIRERDRSGRQHRLREMKSIVQFQFCLPQLRLAIAKSYSSLWPDITLTEEKALKIVLINLETRMRAANS